MMMMMNITLAVLSLSTSNTNQTKLYNEKAAKKQKKTINPDTRRNYFQKFESFRRNRLKDFSLCLRLISNFHPKRTNSARLKDIF